MGLRKERLADEIRDTIAVCFTAGNMRDPRLENITITAVKLTADLQLASVYYRVMGADRPGPNVEMGLASAVGFLRRRVAEALDVRRVPNLRFFYDESVEYGSKIEGLLSNLNA